MHGPIPIRKQAARRALKPVFHPPRATPEPKPAPVRGGLSRVRTQRRPKTSLVPQLSINQRGLTNASLIGGVKAARNATPRQIARAGLNPDAIYEGEDQLAQQLARGRALAPHAEAAYRLRAQREAPIIQRKMMNPKSAYNRDLPITSGKFWEGYGKGLLRTGQMFEPTTIKKALGGKGGTITAQDIGLDSLFFLPWSRGLRGIAEAGIAAREGEGLAQATRSGVKSYREGQGLFTAAGRAARRQLVPSARALERSPNRQSLIRAVHEYLPRREARAQVQIFDQAAKHMVEQGLAKSQADAYAKVEFQLHSAANAPGDIKGLYQHIPPHEVPAMPEKLNLRGMPHRVYKMIKQGAPYRDWYKRAAANLTAEAERLGVTPREMAGVTAVMSQQANPTFNLRRAVEAIREYKATGQITPTRYFAGQADKATRILNGTFDWSGMKTNSFFGNFMEHMDPEQWAREFAHQPVTVDRHIAEMMLGKQRISDKQYEQIQQVFQNAADKLGWTPSEVQAAAWVPFKAQKQASSTEVKALGKELMARGEIPKHLMPTEGMPKKEQIKLAKLRAKYTREQFEAGRRAEDFVPQPPEAFLGSANDAYDQGRAMQYQAALHREHTFNSGVAQVHSEANPDAELHSAIRGAYDNASPETQRIYDRLVNKTVDGQFEPILGLEHIGSHEGQGIWRGKATEGIASHLLIGHGPVSQETRDKLEALAAAQGLAKHQNSVAWGRPVKSGGEFTGVHWSPGPDQNPAQLSAAMDTVAGEGNVGFVHAPDGGFYVIDFAGGNEGPISRLGGYQQPIGWDGGYVIHGDVKKANDFGASYQEAIDKMPPEIRGRLLQKINQVRAHVDMLDKSYLHVPVPQVVNEEGARALAEQGGHTFHGTSPLNAESIMAERRLRTGGSDPEAAWTTTDPGMAAFYGRGEEPSIVAIPRHAIPDFKEGPFGVHGAQADILFQQDPEFMQIVGAMSKHGHTIRGAYDIENSIIHLVKENAQIGTLPHEMAHFLVRMGIGDETKGVFEKWIGDKTTRWGESQHEQFARGLEAFIRSGDAPANLKHEFEVLYPGFARVYPKAGDLPKLPPEVVDAYKTLLGQKDGLANTAYYLIRYGALHLHSKVAAEPTYGPRSEYEAQHHIEEVKAALRARGFGLKDSEIPRIEPGSNSPEHGGQLGRRIREHLAGYVDKSGMGTYEGIGAGMDVRPAREIRAEKEALLREERSKRLGAAEQARRAAGGGLEGHIAAKEQLKGAMPNVRTHALDFNQHEVNDAINFVNDHPGLADKGFAKIRAADAIDRLTNGETITESEQKLLEHVFGRQESPRGFKAAWKAKGWKDRARDIVNIPRSFMATLDQSATFRHGLLAGAHNPKLWAKEWGPMYKAMFSEGNFAEQMAAIHELDTYPLMVSRPNVQGLAMTSLSSDLTKREEQYASNMAEEIPGIGKIVRASDRGYVGFLNNMRAVMADSLYRHAAEQGWDLNDEHLIDSINKFVNSATGRGDLGAFQKHAVTLNTLLFSPRLLWSRLNFLNPMFYYKLHPFARRQAWQSLRNLLAITATVLTTARLAGAQVVLDPRNADFGKMKFGNTRIDFLGGFQQPVRLAAQMWSGIVVSSATGKTEHLSGKPFGVSRLSVLWKFFENKLAPVPSGLVSAGEQKDLQTNEPLGWSSFTTPSIERNFILSRTVPLLIQDITSLPGWQKGILAPLPAMGIGTQSYGPPPAAKKEMDKLNQDSIKAGLGPVPKAVEQDAHWKGELDNLTSQGMSPIDKAKAAAKVFDERYGTHLSEQIIPKITTQGEADKLYSELRARISPAFDRWQSLVTHSLNVQKQEAPVSPPKASSAPAPVPASSGTVAPAEAPLMQETAYHPPTHGVAGATHTMGDLPHELGSAILSAAARYDVPAPVLAGIWRIESGSTFPNPAVNGLGYGGLFGTKKWNASTQEQADYAAQTLHHLLVQHGGNLGAALSAYSGGGYTSVPGANGPIHIGGSSVGQGSSLGDRIPGSPAADQGGFTQEAVDQQGLADLASGHYNPSVQIMHLFRAAATAPIKSSVGGIQFELPPGGARGSKTARGAIALAQHYLGTKYVWGGDKPGGFDCSGLLYYVWGQQGIRIPRTSQQQWDVGMPVGKGQLQPGDAVFFEPGANGPGHVGMYIGHGMFIEAPHTGSVVRISRLAGYPGYVGARRFTAGRRA